MLMHDRASRPQRTTLRSCSQPPSIGRKGRAFGAITRSSHRGWLQDYHLCPLESRYHLIGQVTEDLRYPRFPFGGLSRGARQIYSARHCAKGMSRGYLVQESVDWKDHSYLARIAYCQDGHSSRHRSKNSKRLAHTGTRDCPQGCYKVHLDRFLVPESLRLYHPTREFMEDLWD